VQVGEDLVQGSDHAPTSQDGLVRVDVDALVALSGVDVDLCRVVKRCVRVLASDHQECVEAAPRPVRQLLHDGVAGCRQVGGTWVRCRKHLGLYAFVDDPPM